MTSLNRISDVRLQDLQTRQLTEEQLQRRVELHTSDTIERLTSIGTGDTQIALPTSEPDQQSALKELYRNASPEQQRAFTQVSFELAGALMEASSDSPLTEASAGLQGVISHATEQYIMTTGRGAVDEITQGVLYLAIDGVEAETYELAMSLQDTMNLSKLKREELAEFRNTMADWPEGTETQEFTWTEFDENGQMIEKSENLTKEGADAKLNELESQLATTGEDRQMWQMKLQDAMQKQQQAMQTLSNIMKNFHDTGKAIIQNMRG